MDLMGSVLSFHGGRNSDKRIGRQRAVKSTRTVGQHAKTLVDDIGKNATKAQCAKKRRLTSSRLLSVPGAQAKGNNFAFYDLYVGTGKNNGPGKQEGKIGQMLNDFWSTRSVQNTVL